MNVSTFSVNSPAYSTYPVEVNGNIRSISTASNPLRGIIENQITNDMASCHFAGFRARGTPNSLSAIQAGDFIVSVTPDPYDGFQYLIPGILGFEVTPGSSISNGIVDTDFVVYTSSGVPDGFERIRTTWDGITEFNQSGKIGGTVNISALPATNALHIVSTDNTFGTVFIQQNGTANALDVMASSSVFHVSGTGAPPNSQALCLLAGQLGHCTTVVGASGGCTCAAP
jgi:hypothetical protein